MRLCRTTPILAFLLLIPLAAAAAPGVGAHALSYYLMTETEATYLGTPPMTSQATGSTFVVGVGRGKFEAFTEAPFDNKNNGSYTMLGSAHRYTAWENSGTALYVRPAITGGTAHAVAVATPPWDETTLTVVEVTNGGAVQDFRWNEVLAGDPVTSLSVTTTGPATLVAFWWGDGHSGPYTVTPNNGFVVRDTALSAGWLVQCVAATRAVTAAGTYNVTWTASPEQGAQLWLVAVQSAALSAVPGAGTGVAFALEQNYPNPFNPSTTIRYAIPEGTTGRTSLRVYDVAGRTVATLVDGVEEPGTKSIQFNAANLASGVYFYKLMVEPFAPSGQGLVEVKQFVLLR